MNLNQQFCYEADHNIIHNLQISLKNTQIKVSADALSWCCSCNHPGVDVFFPTESRATTKTDKKTVWWINYLNDAVKAPIPALPNLPLSPGCRSLSGWFTRCLWAAGGGNPPLEETTTFSSALLRPPIHVSGIEIFCASDSQITHTHAHTHRHN